MGESGGTVNTRRADPCSLIRGTNIRRRAVEMMSSSSADGKERGVLIFKKRGKLRMTGTSIGESHDIDIPFPSLLGMGLVDVIKPIGSIHTHPNERHESLFSATDLQQLFENDLIFSASLFDEGDSVIADVFTKGNFETFDELKESVSGNISSMGFISRANEELIECTLNLGSVRQ